ncbi:MAG: hypothetical protein AAB875_03630, partial [Patescibacteria group bacterium]
MKGSKEETSMRRKQGASPPSDDSSAKILAQCKAERSLAKIAFDNEVSAFNKQKADLRFRINAQFVRTVMNYDGGPEFWFGDEIEKAKAFKQRRENNCQTLLETLKELSVFDSKEFKNVLFALETLEKEDLNWQQFYR